MKQILLFSILFSCIPTLLFSQNTVPEHLNLSKNNLALHGYDPVSYFFDEEPQKGKEDLTYTWKGGIYRFANEKYRALFQENPGQFAPQYGGWCAYAIAIGKKVEISPKSYTITDGKLYLFYKRFGYNALPAWKKDEANLIQEADNQWKTLKIEQ